MYVALCTLCSAKADTASHDVCMVWGMALNCLDIGIVSPTQGMDVCVVICRYKP